MGYLIGYCTYHNPGIKLGISPNYSATLGLKTGCHGYFMLLDICRWVVYKVNYVRYVLENYCNCHCGSSTHARIW